MAYRLLHNKFFYLIMVLLIIGEIFSFFTSELNGLSSASFANHTYHTIHDHDTETEEDIYVNFEEEDPLVLSKMTQSVINGTFENVPGHDALYKPSFTNTASVSAVLHYAIILIFAADGVFIMFFFGEMFSDDAIRNMITVKTRKEFIYLSSIIVNTLIVTAMYLLTFLVITACILIKGYYPIFYTPALIAAIAVGSLVTITVAALFIFILFMAQHALLSFIFCGLLVVLSGSCAMMGVYPGMPFENEYEYDQIQLERFFKGGYTLLGDKEWYIPVDGFDPVKVYVPEEDLTISFVSDTPNEFYTGKFMNTVGRYLFRANIFYYPFELVMWFIYPMYRDGIMTRYAAVSASYFILLLTAGSYAVRKRNIN